MKKTTHSLLLAIVASAILLPVCASHHEPIGVREAIQIRAVLAPATSADSPETSAAAETTAQAATSAAQSPSTTAAIATSSAAATAATSPPSAGETTTHASSASASASTPPGAAVTSVLATATNAAGQVVTSYIVSTPTVSSAAPPPTGTSNGSDSGLSTGSIIGLSVSGGIAALGIIGFFIWKFTRKRFADFDDSTSDYVSVSYGLMRTDMFR